MDWKEEGCVILFSSSKVEDRETSTAGSGAALGLLSESGGRGLGPPVVMHVLSRHLCCFSVVFMQVLFPIKLSVFSRNSVGSVYA